MLVLCHVQLCLAVTFVTLSVLWETHLQIMLSLILVLIRSVVYWPYLKLTRFDEGPVICVTCYQGHLSDMLGSHESERHAHLMAECYSIIHTHFACECIKYFKFHNIRIFVISLQLLLCVQV